VGFGAVFEHFSGFEFFLLSNIFLARPHATNANRWAVPCTQNNKGKFSWKIYYNKA
jgi:hypothetical protein